MKAAETPVWTKYNISQTRDQMLILVKASVDCIWSFVRLVSDNGVVFWDSTDTIIIKKMDKTQQSQRHFDKKYKAYRIFVHVNFFSKQPPNTHNGQMDTNSLHEISVHTIYCKDVDIVINIDILSQNL